MPSDLLDLISRGGVPAVCATALIALVLVLRYLRQRSAVRPPIAHVVPEASAPGERDADHDEGADDEAGGQRDVAAELHVEMHAVRRAKSIAVRGVAEEAEQDGDH